MRGMTEIFSTSYDRVISITRISLICSWRTRLGPDDICVKNASTVQEITDRQRQRRPMGPLQKTVKVLSQYTRIGSK
jgi:hypothetical protein